MPNPLEQLVSATQARLAVLGQARADGTIDGLTFRGQVQGVLKDAHITSAALARGGFENLDRSTTGFVGARLRSEYSHLAVLVLDTNLDGFDGRAAARLAQYGNGAIRGTESAVRRRDAVAAGHDQERNVTSGGVASCDQCLALAALGWVEAGTIPEIGSRTCAGNDACTIETRSSAAVTADSAA